MFVSSTKPTAVVVLLFSSGSSEDAKNKNRMGDSVEPCGIPADTRFILS